MMMQPGWQQDLYNSTQISASPHPEASAGGLLDTPHVEAPPQSYNLENYQKGIKVRHESRGPGKVMEVDSHGVQVQFELEPVPAFFSTQELATGSLQIDMFSVPAPAMIPAMPMDSGLDFPQLPDFTPAEKEYQLNDTLGSGAFGTVYKAMGLRGTIAAIKQIPVDSDNSKAREEAESEFQLLRRLDHKHVVRVLQTYYDTNDDGVECIHIVMEYMAGGSIHTLMEEGGGWLREETTRHYTFQTLLGLQYLHEMKVVHSDLKPMNLLVSASGDVKLSDFGLSRTVTTNKGGFIDSMECGSVAPEAEGHAAGEPSGVRGTVMYMSPALVVTNGHNFQTDIWALGCTVLEMATGVVPWAERGFRLEVQYLRHLQKCHTDLEGSPLIPTAPGAGALHRDHPGLTPGGDLVSFIQRCFAAEQLGTDCTHLREHAFIKRDMGGKIIKEEDSCV